jgi:hypothetical protein
MVREQKLATLLWQEVAMAIAIACPALTGTTKATRHVTIKYYVNSDT